MITKKQFKNKYEVNDYINFLVIHNEFTALAEEFENKQDDINWVEPTSEYITNMAGVLTLYVNDTDRDINIRKRNKEQFGIQNREAWITWVENANRLKDDLNSARQHAEEIKNMLCRQKKALNRKNSLYKKSEQIRVKRQVIFLTLHSINGYESLVLFSDLNRFQNNSEALLIIDSYISLHRLGTVVVDFKLMTANSDWNVDFVEMVNIDTY